MSKIIFIFLVIIFTTVSHSCAQISQLIEILNENINDRKISLQRVSSGTEILNQEVIIDRDAYLVMTKNIDVELLNKYAVTSQKECEALVDRFNKNYSKDIRFKASYDVYRSVTSNPKNVNIKLEDSITTITIKNQSSSIDEYYSHSPIIDSILNPNRYEKLTEIWALLMRDYYEISDDTIHMTSTSQVQGEKWFEVDSVFCLNEPCLKINKGIYDVRVARDNSYDIDHNFAQVDWKPFFDTVRIKEISDSIIRKKQEIVQRVQYDTTRMSLSIPIVEFNSWTRDSIDSLPLESLIIGASNQPQPFISDLILEIGSLRKLSINTSIQLLPPALYKLSNLQTLKVEADLKYLPKELCKIRKLIELDLFGNDFRYLPRQIGRLSEIRKIELGHNRLINLPRSLGRLDKLRRLSLHNNKLETLPKNFGRLRSLQYCSLIGNNLTDLDFKGNTMDSLVYFDLSRNKFKQFPASLLEIPNLRHLLLDKNFIRELPLEISKLTKLQALSLNSNELTTLPESIGTLTNLHALKLKDNKLTELPETLSKLRNLKELDLRGNDIPANSIKWLREQLPECRILAN